MTVSMHKTLAVLKLPTPVPALLGVTEAILVAMTDNPGFPAPVPALAEVAAALADLHAAEIATHTRTRGTVAARNEARTVLVGLLVRLKAYVQGVADADPDRAPALIESAGLYLKQRVVPARPPFAVKPGAVSGSVQLVVRSAGDRATYHWAWSTDGAATWHLAPATMQSRTAITGLPSGATCSFRYRVVTKDGEGDWSQPLALQLR